MYIKLTKLHLVGIVILSLLLGSLGILGVKEAYENLKNPKKRTMIIYVVLLLKKFQEIQN